MSKSKFDSFAPILVLVSILLAFAVGALWVKVSSLEDSKSALAGKVAQVNDNDTFPAEEVAIPPSDGKLSDEQSQTVVKVSSADHINGDENAQVYLIEYSDFECPFCSQFHDTAQQVVDEYNGQVAWVYRHFPLDSIHPNARPAAIASECVAEASGNTGFWSFVDSVFANQTTALADIEGTAASAAGASVADCIANASTGDIVEAQYQGGLEAGITGTPGNFVINQNGDIWLVSGAVPFESLQATIDEALAG